MCGHKVNVSELIFVIRSPEVQQRETKSDNVQSQVAIIGDSKLHGINDRGLMNRQRKIM